jgi:hypothetical protein
LSRWSLHPVLSRGGGRLAAARLRGGRGLWTGWICSVSFCLGAARLGLRMLLDAGFHKPICPRREKTDWWSLWTTCITY